MFSMDPRKQAEQLFGIVATIFVCCGVIRLAFEVIRPALPFVFLLAVLAAGVRLWLIWRRRY